MQGLELVLAALDHFEEIVHGQLQQSRGVRDPAQIKSRETHIRTTPALINPALRKQIKHALRISPKAPIHNPCRHIRINSTIRVVREEEVEDEEGDIGDGPADAFFVCADERLRGGGCPAADGVEGGEGGGAIACVPEQVDELERAIRMNYIPSGRRRNVQS